MKKILGITIAYFLFGIVWIITTDSFSEAYFDKDYILKFQTYKGLLFVFISTSFVFFSSWYFYKNILWENNQSRIFKKIQDIIIENSKSFTWIYNMNTNSVNIRGRMNDHLTTGSLTDIDTLVEFYKSNSNIENFSQLIEDFRQDKIDSLQREYQVSIDGEFQTFKFYIISLTDFEGSNYLIAHSENISDYKKMMEQVKYNNKILNSILRAIPDILIVLENKTFITKYLFARNPSDLLISSEEALGRDLRELLPSYLRVMLEEKFKEDEGFEKPIVYELKINNYTHYYEARFVSYEADSTMIIVRNITNEYEAFIEKEIYLEQLQNAENILNFAYWTYDSFTGKKYISPRLSTIFQCEIKTLEDSKKMFERILYEDIGFILENYALFTENKPMKDGAFRFRSDDGAVKYIMQKIINKPRPKGYLYQGVFIDITEEINNAMKLREKSFYLNIFSRYTDDIIFTYDIDLDKIDYLSHSAFKYIDQKEADTVRDTFFKDYFIDNITEKIKEFSKKNYHENSSVETQNNVFETILKKHKQIPIWVDISLYKIESDLGIKVLGIIRNIHDKKNYLSELEQANLRFWYAVRATSDAIWDWNIDTNEFSWTENLELYFGHKVSELPGTLQALTDLCHPDEVHNIRESLYDAIKENKNYWERQHKFLNANGEYKFVHNRAALIVRDGTVRRIIGAIHDITTEKNAMNQLTIQNARLREIAWTQSHVVRAPLARLMGLIEMYDLLKETDIDEKELRGLIYNSAKELDEIIYQITFKTENI